MKKQSMLLLLLAVAGAALISFAGDTPGQKPAGSPDLGEMRNEITDLRAKVQALEDRMKGLESTVAQMKQPHLMPLTVPQPNSSLLNRSATDSTPPKTWGERQVNGWTFYIVPCDQKAP